MEGFWEAKIVSQIVFGGVLFNVFFGCVFVLIFDGFLEAPHAFRLAMAQSKRMSAILDDDPKGIKIL